MTKVENKPEFSRCVKIDTIGNGETVQTISATPEERAALAKRFDLLSLDSLEADIGLRKEADGIIAAGILRVTCEQACIASGDPVPATFEERMDVKFVLEIGAPSASDKEVELAPEDCDIMIYDGRVVDIGEAVAQSLGLSLNPYPRSNDAEAKLRALGVKSEDEAAAQSGPFAGLSAMKDQLRRK